MTLISTFTPLSREWISTYTQTFQICLLWKSSLSSMCKTSPSSPLSSLAGLIIKLTKDTKRRFYTWTSPDGQHRNQIDYILCSQRWRSSIQSAKTRRGADCGSDHEFFIAKFRLKLKKVGKIPRPFRYDLNKIPYDYTVEVRNRFKGLDLTDRLPDELWTEVHNIVEETGIKSIPMEKKYKKANWLFEEALQIAVKRREVKSNGEQERYSHLNAEFQRTARRDKKV